MFHDYCLKFDTEEECMQFLFDENGISKYTAIDVIGVINKVVEESSFVNDEGIDTKNITVIPLDGYHANVRHNEECPELLPYVISPNTPSRVWF